MEKAAQRRMPRFAWDYLAGGLGREASVRRNLAAMEEVVLMPRYLADGDEPDICASLFGHRFNAPFAVAPLGLAGLLWPGSELPLAEAAMQHNVPYILSTFANTSLEAIRPAGGEHSWFQFYPPNDPAMEYDMLDRARKAGYDVLVVTVDIPASTRRERDIRNGLTIPPVYGLSTIMQVAMRPSWAMGILQNGVPDFANLSPYYPKGSSLSAAAEFVGRVMTGDVTRERFKKIRDAWPGKILVKGVLRPDEAEEYVSMGGDGLIVSNHGGRQLDAAPSATEVIGEIRARLGPETLLLADGGVRSGLDIARMLALGADFVLIGRAFLFASAAIGRRGGDHLMNVLKAELTATMAQLGCRTVEDLPACRWREAGGRRPNLTSDGDSRD
ncbi:MULTISPECIES: alpha-hydroxy acid oxidase [unclassified Rhizobium]|uniref:alpha-hydroxy acid oxidase n=1 Tax=unclassified Rhizobium TaxID=2613769 RepID=UPI0013DD953F|nr:MULTISPECIES: alpha-hydroxy acid oxidase [unclassified Rhizobium]